MNTEDLKKYLSKEYQGSQSFLENIIYPIFGEEEFVDGYEMEILDGYPEYRRMADATGIRSVKDVGMIYIDGEPLQIFDISVSDHIMMERNRVTIQSLVRRIMDQYSNAFMLFHYEDTTQWNWRFTYCHKSTNKEESTDSKRYTFLLGPKQSCRTAAENFQSLFNKHKTDGYIAISDIIQAFSVEALSKEFFDGYKKQYEDIIQYITGKRMVKVANKWEEKIVGEPNPEIMQEFSHFSNPEKSVRDYVKKLMGRLVFLQFLQKKGWLGVPADKSWGEGSLSYIKDLFDRTEDKDNFVDNVLEVLFNDLNTERANDLVSPSLGKNIRVPYLNGGLFERDAADETKFSLPESYMRGLLEFFSYYNFTIDENDPDDAEVGVDPEMLGRIFENLLEDNKDKGAFYTPKEIVSYMCRESLIAYLQTDIEDDATKEAIRQFVTTHDANALGTNGKFRHQVDEALKNVKICDPAIGSGAFPMGLLKELFQCRTALEGIDQSKAAEIKKHIIQQNIYGVDIEKGAVDIARLRFWLSLIVDEETPQALPNLDYKIVEGNSLITTFDGQYIDLSLNWLESKRYSIVKIRPEKKALQEEQRRFYTLSGEEKYRSEIAIKNHILNIIWYQLDYEKQSWENATVEQAGIFGISEKKGRKKNKAQVVEFTQERQAVLDKCEKLMAKLNDESKSLQERASVNIPFFEWQTVFSEVFEDENKKGFDIVIGNPPYIRVQNLRHELIDLYKKVFSTAWKRVDISTLFIEKMMGNISSKGVLCYITSNQFLSAEYGRLLRKYILYNKLLNKIVDFAGLPVFESAITYVSIFFLSHKKSESFDYYRVSKLPLANPESFSKCLYDDFTDEPWSFVFSEDKNLLKKIQSFPSLSEIAFAKGGIITGNDDIFIFKSENYPVEKDVSLDLIRTDDIQRYYLGRPQLKIFYPCNYGNNGDTEVIPLDSIKYLYPQAYKHIQNNESILKARKDSRNVMGDKKHWYQPVRFGTLKLFKGKKILGPGIVNHNKFVLDDEGYAFSFGNMYAIATNNTDIDLKVLLGILNSKLVEYYLHKVAPVKQGGYFSYGATVLEKIPLNYPNENTRKKILELVEIIISEKKKNCSFDTTAFESEIDHLVYHLYGLTEEEIKIVEES